MPSYRNWNPKYENLSSAELQQKYNDEQAEFKSKMDGLLSDAHESLTQYNAKSQTPYTKRIISILQNRISQDKTALAKNCTLSYKPDQTYGDSEMGAVLRDAGFPISKTQDLINTFYRHANEQNDIVSYYREAKAREDREKKEAGTYVPSGKDPVLYTYSPDGLTVYEDPETGKEITGDEYKKKPKEVVDPHDYNVDQYGNILGIDISDDNRITSNDSKDIVAAKHKAQLRTLLHVRNKGEGSGTYKKSKKDLLKELMEKSKEKKKDTEKQKKLSLSSAYSKTYTTFSGEDMVVTVEIPVDEAKGVSISRTIGQFQTISYSMHNEKTPVRNIGNMNARTYVFGPRTIAGSIVLIVFNRHWVREMLAEYNQKAHIFSNYLTDELPPVNITISAANEYGKKAKLSLYGVTFVNEAQVMSINDLYMENTYEFFAQDIDYLTPVHKTKNKRNYSTCALPVKDASGKTSNKKDSVTQTKGSKSKPATVSSSDVQLDPPILYEYSDADSYICDLKEWKDKNFSLWDAAYKANKCTAKEKTDGKQSIKNRYDALLKDAYARQREEDPRL